MSQISQLDSNQIMTLLRSLPTVFNKVLSTDLPLHLHLHLLYHPSPCHHYTSRPRNPLIVKRPHVTMSRSEHERVGHSHGGAMSLFLNFRTTSLLTTNTAHRTREGRCGSDALKPCPSAIPAWPPPSTPRSATSLSRPAARWGRDAWHQRSRPIVSPPRPAQPRTTFSGRHVRSPRFCVGAKAADSAPRPSSRDGRERG